MTRKLLDRLYKISGSSGKQDLYSPGALVHRWKAEVFEPDIYPGFPFRNGAWRAIAFNRDVEGNLRLPLPIWRSLLGELSARAGDTVALIASPYEISEGAVAGRCQPFMIPLNEKSVVNHFSRMELYLPEFFMADSSGSWAVWGDSDLTVLGAEAEIIIALVAKHGGEQAVVARMLSDFGLEDAAETHEFVVYLKQLVAGAGQSS